MTEQGSPMGKYNKGDHVKIDVADEELGSSLR